MKQHLLHILIGSFATTTLGYRIVPLDDSNDSKILSFLENSFERTSNSLSDPFE